LKKGHISPQNPIRQTWIGVSSLSVVKYPFSSGDSGKQDNTLILSSSTYIYINEEKGGRKRRREEVTGNNFRVHFGRDDLKLLKWWYYC